MIHIIVINWLISSFLNGLFFTCIFVFLFYWFYLKELPKNEPGFRAQYEDFRLDDVNLEFFKRNSFRFIFLIFFLNRQTLASFLEKNKDFLKGDSQSCIALNMMFQFLFQELKDTKAVRRYIIRKMTYEFNEILTTKGGGKFIQRISVSIFQFFNQDCLQLKFLFNRIFSNRSKIDSRFLTNN